MKKFEASLNITPFDLFSHINPEDGSMFFDSALTNIPYSRYSILLVQPEFLISFQGNQLKIKNKKEVIISTANPLNELKSIFSQLKEKYSEFIFESDSFSIGFAGYFSYDYGMRIEKVESKKTSTTNLPEIFLGFFTSALVFDHHTKKYTAYSIDDPKKLLDFIFYKLKPEKKLSQQNKDLNFISNFTKSEYLQTVQKVRKYIEEGEVYQINLSQQFVGEVNLNPIEIYKRVRKFNPAQFGALICIDKERWILSTSPELFVHLKDGFVITKPIKGTIRRGKDQNEDEILKEELLQSEKDSAELLMIVDLERNDLGKVCKPGSVQVKRLKQIETYSSVHHLVAEITGELKDGKDFFDLLEAMFPGGSITGAPKKRSMEIIDELEKSRRGVYTGSIGYINLNGDAMFNIAIRTLVYEKGKLYLNLGGGIIYDSIPEKEYDETLQKGKAIFNSLAGDL